MVSVPKQYGRMQDDTAECINDTSKYKMINLSTRSELKKAQTPTWTTLLLG